MISINIFVTVFGFNNNESSLDYDEEKWYWNKEEYPNPYEQPPYCRRTKPSYVCDPDQILSRKEGQINNFSKQKFRKSLFITQY